MRASLLILGTMLLLFACNKKNSYVIPQDQMVDILVDIHLTEGIITDNVDAFFKNEDKYTAYKTIYKKYGIDEMRFDSSLTYYSKETHLFVQIYDSVITHLMKIETDVQTGKYFQPNLLKVDSLIQKSFPQDSLLKDSIFNEFWNLPRSFSISADGGIDQFVFRIDVDTSYGFEYRLYTDIEIHPTDSCENPQIKVEMEYRDSTKSNVALELLVDSMIHTYALVLKIDSGKTPKTLKGTLYEDTVCLVDKSLEIKNIRMYEIGDPGIVNEMRYKGLIFPKE